MLPMSDDAPVMSISLHPPQHVARYRSAACWQEMCQQVLDCNSDLPSIPHSLPGCESLWMYLSSLVSFQSLHHLGLYRSVSDCCDTLAHLCMLCCAGHAANQGIYLNPDRGELQKRRVLLLLFFAALSHCLTSIRAPLGGEKVGRQLGEHKEREQGAGPQECQSAFKLPV